MGRISLKADDITFLWLLIILFKKTKPKQIHSKTVLHLKMTTKKNLIYRDVQGDMEIQGFGALWNSCLILVPSM